MQALMLIAASAGLIPAFKRTMAKSFPTALISDLASERGFALEFPGEIANRIYIENYGSNLENIGWEVPEITFITSYFPHSHQVYSIAYHSIDTVKAVIVKLVDSNEALVDNDCGTLMLGQDFVRKVLTEPNWYWFDDLK